MDQIKEHISPKKRSKSAVNPFIKMCEDKEKIAHTIEEGKPLSSLKDITFVKPL